MINTKELKMSGFEEIREALKIKDDFFTATLRKKLEEMKDLNLGQSLMVVVRSEAATKTDEDIKQVATQFLEYFENPKLRYEIAVGLRNNKEKVNN